MVLSDFSIKRPIAMSALIIGLTLLGLQAFRKMPIEFLPSMDIPVITVQTIYPGASPDQLETDVAKRIEDKMMTLDGLETMTSTCMENVCLTQLEFVSGTDGDLMATDVREKLNMIREDFPADVEDPIIQKFDINAIPVVSLALSGEVSRAELYDYANNTLKDRLSTIPGVAECTLIGGAEREVHILLDREKLAARGLDSSVVVSAVQNAVKKIPSGRIRDRGREYTVEFDGEYKEVDEIANLILTAESGRRCYLRDVATVRMATEELRQKATFNGKPCISIEVVKKEEANAVAVVDRVRKELEKLKPQLPGGMQVDWFKDEGKFIRATASSAWEGVAQGIMLTALILFLFLWNIRSTFVIAITMPLTIIIGLFGLQFLGYTLNTSTLISIGLSVGILVTNSIVVMEAIVKHLDEGNSPFDAAFLGAKETWIPVLASAGTNVVVLFPIAMITVTVGQFLRPLVVTMIVMTVVSLFISFTLTPMLCMLVLRNKREKSKYNPLGYLEKGWNAGFAAVTSWYHAYLGFLSRWRSLAFGVNVLVVLLFFFSVKQAGRIGGSFFTDSDKGEITVRLEFPTGYSLEATEARVREAEALLKQLPELSGIMTTVGKIQGVAGQASEGVYLGQVQLKFSERDQREISLDELLDRARVLLDGFPDCIVGIFQPSAIGGISNDIEIYFYGDDLEVLDQIGLQAQRWAEAEGSFTEVDVSVREGKRKISILPRRAELADLKLPAVGVGMALRGNLEGRDAGTFTLGDRNYDIVVKFDEEMGRGQIERFLVPTAPGKSQPIGTVATLQEKSMPIQILRKDKRRVCKFSSNSRVAIGLSIPKLMKYLETILPPGYEAKVAGEAERMEEGNTALGEAALTAILLVVLTLAAIMESWKQPALILITLPLAMIGFLWALLVFGETFSLFVVMSLVMLIGIVVNNAILIMDQFNVLVAQGVASREAMIRAGSERLRPIVMITVAAVLGMLPMAVARGIGAEMRTGVGVASAGGILASGILTLVVIPVLYNIFTRTPEKTVPTEPKDSGNDEMGKQEETEKEQTEEPVVEEEASSTDKEN